MLKTKNLFIRIDNFLFKKLDAFKSDGSFQKINEIISVLDEDKQKIFAQVLAFALLLIPYLFVCILWWGNFKTKKNLEIKSQILEQIATLSSSKDALISISSNFLAPTPIQGQEDLDNKIRNLMSVNSIEQNKVHVLSFSQLTTTSSISKIEARLSFQGFGTQDFSNFMRALVESEKFKVLKINLTKNNESNLLQGEVSLMHMGRNSSM